MVVAYILVYFDKLRILLKDGLSCCGMVWFGGRGVVWYVYIA